jgi:hypothetical protein
VRRITAAFFATIRAEDWERHTEPREKGWMLWECLAHVTSIAEAWYGAVEQVLAGQPVTYPGLTRRTDLPAVNQQEIAARQHIPPAQLVDNLLTVLEKIALQAEKLTPEQLGLNAPCPAYNRPLTVGEMLGCQADHLCIVHGAQLANAVGAPPLWTACSPDLLNRLVTYLFHQVSHSYWVERGGNLQAGINFYAHGQKWHLAFAPDGGHGGAGWVARPSIWVWASSPNVLCKLFTVQITPMQGILRGQLLGIGNLPLAFRIPYLLNPT